MRSRKLTWQSGINGRAGRWRKKYRGKMYYFDGGRGKSDRVAEDAANAAWEALKKALDRDTVRPNEPEYRQALAEWEQVLVWCRKYDDPTMASTAIEKIDSLKAKLASPVLPRLPRGLTFDGQFDFGIRYPGLKRAMDAIADQVFPREEVSKGAKLIVPPSFIFDEFDPLAEQRIIWRDRLQIESSQASPPDATVEAQVDEYLSSKRKAAESGSVSLGRIENVRAHLVRFRDWIGAKTLVADINGKKVTDYHAYLIAGVTKGEWSAATAAERMSALRSFMKRLWLLEKISALPRILATNSRELGIAKPQRTAQTFAAEEVLKLLRNASGRTRLYLLLMLNCGMTQKDISDLQHEEVDWDSGRITRKRSKTRQHENVPTVSFKLWPETLRLLRQHRTEPEAEAVLVNAGGQRLWQDSQTTAGKYQKIDNIRTAYERLRQKVGISKPLKALRKTSASLIANHNEFRGLEDLFLGHAPRRISDRHYVRTSPEILDQAISWLRQALQVHKLERKDATDPATSDSKPRTKIRLVNLKKSKTVNGSKNKKI